MARNGSIPAVQRPADLAWRADEGNPAPPWQSAEFTGKGSMPINNPLTNKRYVLIMF
jgi:hypothetical protein